MTEIYIYIALALYYFQDGPAQQQVKLCDACGHKAKHYCFQCKESLCESCMEAHQQEDMFRGHKTASLDKVAFCTTHEVLVVQRYCIDCSQPICTRCVISGHKGHKTEDLEKV